MSNTSNCVSLFDFNTRDNEARNKWKLYPIAGSSKLAIATHSRIILYSFRNRSRREFSTQQSSNFPHSVLQLNNLVYAFYEKEYGGLSYRTLNSDVKSEYPLFKKGSGYSGFRIVKNRIVAIYRRTLVMFRLDVQTNGRLKARHIGRVAQNLSGSARFMPYAGDFLIEIPKGVVQMWSLRSELPQIVARIAVGSDDYKIEKLDMNDQWLAYLTSGGLVKIYSMFDWKRNPREIKVASLIPLHFNECSFKLIGSNHFMYCLGGRWEGVVGIFNIRTCERTVLCDRQVFDPENRQAHSLEFMDAMPMQPDIVFLTRHKNVIKVRKIRLPRDIFSKHTPGRPLSELPPLQNALQKLYIGKDPPTTELCYRLIRKEVVSKSPREWAAAHEILILAVMDKQIPPKPAFKDNKSYWSENLYEVICNLSSSMTSSDKKYVRACLKEAVEASVLERTEVTAIRIGINIYADLAGQMNVLRDVVVRAWKNVICSHQALEQSHKALARNLQQYKRQQLFGIALQLVPFVGGLLANIAPVGANALQGIIEFFTGTAVEVNKYAVENLLEAGEKSLEKEALDGIKQRDRKMLNDLVEKKGGLEIGQLRRRFEKGKTARRRLRG